MEQRTRTRTKWMSACLALVMITVLMGTGTGYAASTATVTGGWLRLRAEPNTSAVTLASYFTGTVVTVLGKTGNWTYVRTSDGKIGYMSSKYLSEGGIQPGGIAGVVTSSNGMGVRLRTGPGLGYGIIGVYNVGTPVTILNKGTKWSRIDINGTKGYMLNQYVYTGSTPPNTGYQATVVSENGLGVRLRTAASTTSAIIGVYSVGTTVTVLKHGPTWDYVRVGTRTGYMMNKFLTTGAVNTLLSVTLNMQNPAIGSTLLASIKPDGATAVYQWQDSLGNILGTGPSYVVSASVLNRSIRVVATGSGAFSGIVTSGYTLPVTSTPQSGNTITQVNLSSQIALVGQTVTAYPVPANATATYLWIRDDGVVVGSNASYTYRTTDVGYAIRCTVTGFGAFNGAASSAYTSRVAAVPSPSATPLTGTVTVSPAMADPGTWVVATANINAPLDKVQFHWYVNGIPVLVGGNAMLLQASYLPPMGAADSRIDVQVWPKQDSGFSGMIQSTSTLATMTDLP